jgi:hypothetical protein
VTANIAFDVFVKFDGNEHLIGSINSVAGAETTYHVGGGASIPPPTAMVDVILRSNPRVALNTVNLDRIWSGELIYSNVPVSGGNPTTTRAR